MNEQEALLLRAIRHGIMVDFHKVDINKYPEAHKTQETIINKINGIEEECRQLAKKRFDQLELDTDFDPYNLVLNSPIKSIRIVGIFSLHSLMREANLSYESYYEQFLSKYSESNHRKVDIYSGADCAAGHLSNIAKKLQTESDRSVVIFEAFGIIDSITTSVDLAEGDLDFLIEEEKQSAVFLSDLFVQHYPKILDKYCDFMIFDKMSKNHLQIKRKGYEKSDGYEVKTSSICPNGEFNLVFLV